MKTKSTVLACGSALVGALFVGTLTAEADPPIRNVLPRLSHDVVYKTEFCEYIDQPPFVTNIKWDHPLIKGAEAGVTALSRSTMSYGDHVVVYGLDGDNDWNGVKGLYNYWWNKHDADPATREKNLNQIDARVARANYENFIKTLLGECRDYPYMVQKKLEVVSGHAQANKSGPQGDAADQNFLFDSLTGDGYSRLRWIMSEVFSAREQRLNPTRSGFNYPWNEVGHTCNRVDNSVKPFSHAEMRYIYKEWLQGPPKAFNLDQYEAGLQQFIAQNCDPDPNGPDLGYLYDFRGHKNFKANWFECNAFIWFSRDAARVAQAEIRKNQFNPHYYQRPFATRYELTKQLLGAWLFYPSEHHQYMRMASQSGGGPQLYMDNADANGDGLSDYRLFKDVMGQGDIGLESQALPSDQVGGAEVTRTAISTFRASTFARYYDWGFNTFLNVTNSNRAAFATDAVFNDSDGNADATFKLRMARLNQALDRHTNWGPTMMFSPRAYEIAKRYAVRGAHSPIVAMSYEISKSHNFAAGDYPATHPKDQGVTKYMFIVKYRARNYYDERDVKAGKRIRWNDYYLNETSLSNDYYRERALDKFGWIPADDIHACPYLAEADGEDSYYPPWNAGNTMGASGHLGGQ